MPSWRRPGIPEATQPYVIGSVAVLYFNVFVLVAQLFHRIPAMIALAPTQTEPPFLLTQLLVRALFVRRPPAPRRHLAPARVSTVTARPAAARYPPGSSFDEVAMLPVILIALAAGVAVLMITAVPDIRRYLRIRSM